VTKILVIAKSPLPGKVKTRLCPPCTHAEAAMLAEAALADTLDTVSRVRSAEPILVLDGKPGRWVPRGLRVIPQRGDGLAERIAHAFCDAAAPAILIGMDTPQVTCVTLTSAIDALCGGGTDAVLGEATDGGWWIAGMRHAHPGAFDGVPMSTPHTGRAQRERFEAIGLRVRSLPLLRDIDTIDDASCIAAEAPHTRFARAFGEMALAS
jgi:rSAM/selenodomain-associated transferase 1